MAQHQLPPLPYDFNALEPVISGKIMELHYTKHHQAYVNNLNAALEKYKEAENKNDIIGMVSLEPAIRFNGGGHVNHSIFWTNLASPQQGGGAAPQGELAKAITHRFGSLEKLVTKMSDMAIAIQGSGWCWLAYDKASGDLVVTTCPNQDPVLLLTPLLGIDVWEHAYYLQYQNRRADYVKAIWGIVNWGNIQNRFSQAK